MVVVKRQMFLGHGEHHLRHPSTDGSSSSAYPKRRGDGETNE